MSNSQRIFQIGFRKCGTTSLACFFNRNGIPAVHWDDGDLARRMRNNLQAGRRILHGYDERYHAFTDMEFNDPDDYFEGFKHYREMMRDYPDARFILNVRNRDDWLLSMRRWATREGMGDYLRHRYGSASMRRFARELALDWDAHLRSVVASIPATRLLVFDIAADSPEKLCRFLGLPPSAGRHYTREHRSLGAPTYYRRRVLKTLPAPVQTGVRVALRMLGRI